MSSKNEGSKNKWIYIEDENPDDKIDNRPDWTNHKDKKEITFEPVPPTPLEEWLDNKK